MTVGKPAQAKPMKQRFWKSKPALYGAGLLTGVVNGLFGAGGGMLGVVVLERMQGLEKDRAHATALIVMLPLSVVSLIVYLLRGALEWSVAPWVALGLVPGSIFGAKILGKLKGVWINRIFCILMLAAGVRLFL